MRQSLFCAVQNIETAKTIFPLLSNQRPRHIVTNAALYFVVASSKLMFVQHTYLTYGPLCNGVTQVIYEGVPAYPQPDRVWRIVDKYQVRLLSSWFAFFFFFFFFSLRAMSTLLPFRLASSNTKTSPEVSSARLKDRFKLATPEHYGTFCSCMPRRPWHAFIQASSDLRQIAKAVTHFLAWDILNKTCKGWEWIQKACLSRSAEDLLHQSHHEKSRLKVPYLKSVGQSVVHQSHPFASIGGFWRLLGQEARSVQPQNSGHSGRANQSCCMELVLQCYRQEKMPHRRYLVAGMTLTKTSASLKHLSN